MDILKSLETVNDIVEKCAAMDSDSKRRVVGLVSSIHEHYEAEQKENAKVAAQHSKLVESHAALKKAHLKLKAAQAKPTPYRPGKGW